MSRVRRMWRIIWLTPLVLSPILGAKAIQLWRPFEFNRFATTHPVAFEWLGQIVICSSFLILVHIYGRSQKRKQAEQRFSSSQSFENEIWSLLSEAEFDALTKDRQEVSSRINRHEDSPALKYEVPKNKFPAQCVPTDSIASTELFWNYEFPLATKQRLERMREALAEVYPMSQDDWEAGFRKDANPEREIALWEYVTKFYMYFANKRVPSAAGRQELLTYLLACADGYDSGKAARSRLKHISVELAETIQGCYIFDTFSLDDPVAYPPEENEEWK